MRATGILACALAGAASLGGCGDDTASPGSPDPQTERIDRAAPPPSGWRTVSNRVAGFTLSVPADWSVRKRESATLIRSDDRVLAVTVAADRSEPGRTTPAARYAREAFDAMPGFRRLRVRGSGKVRRSPYETGRVTGKGTLESRGQPQHVQVAAFRRPGRVTYTAVAFGADIGGRMPHRRQLDTLLASFRARRPGS